MNIPETKTLIVREKTHRIKDSLNNEKLGSFPSCATPSAIVAALGEKLCYGLTYECLWVIGMDGNCRPVFVEQVAQGGTNKLCVTSREILFRVCAHNVSSFVLMHNHPSGSSKPTSKDIAMTHDLIEAGEVVGTPCMDHIIVTDGDGWSSMLDLGLM